MNHVANSPPGAPANPIFFTVASAQLRGQPEAASFTLAGVANRRALGAYAGLTGTPFASGGMEREQGISKDGNRRMRACLVELAWFWLCF